MPAPVSLSYLLAKNRLDSASPWIVLYEIATGTGVLRITNHPVDVAYNGEVYLAFPVIHEVIAQNQEGTIPQVTVHVSNVTRDVQGILEADDGLRGKQVTIRMVNLDNLAAGDIAQTFVVDSVLATAQVASFVLSKAVPAFGVKFPGRVVTRDLFPTLPAT